jgi:hypothetical protein
MIETSWDSPKQHARTFNLIGCGLPSAALSEAARFFTTMRWYSAGKSALKDLIWRARCLSLSAWTAAARTPTDPDGARDSRGMSYLFCCFGLFVAPTVSEGPRF